MVSKYVHSRRKKNRHHFKHPQFNSMLLSTAELLVGHNGAKTGAIFEGKASSDNENFLQHCDLDDKFLEFRHFDELAVESRFKCVYCSSKLGRNMG